MKKILALIFVGMFSINLMAGPHGGHHGPPPPRQNNGIRLAADIIGLAGMALDVVRPPVVYGGGYCPAAVVPAPPAYAVPQVIPPRPPVYPYPAPNIVVAPVTNVYPYPAPPGAVVVSPTVQPVYPAVAPAPVYYR